MDQVTEVFVGIDVSKERNAIAVAVLVRPRPGSSTGAVVSSAKSRRDVFSRSSRRSCTGLRRKAALPTQSATVDALSTMVIDGTLVKVFAWYDNEMGYATRLVDLAGYLSRFL